MSSFLPKLLEESVDRGSCQIINSITVKPTQELGPSYSVIARNYVRAIKTYIYLLLVYYSLSPRVFCSVCCVTSSLVPQMGYKETY